MTGTSMRWETTTHRELARALQSAQASVILSGYPSPLYDDLYAGWSRLDIATGTGQGSVWQTRTEVLWSNRPLAGQMSLLGLEAQRATHAWASRLDPCASCGGDLVLLGVAVHNDRGRFCSDCLQVGIA